MKSFKRKLRLLGFILLIVLASVGIGFVGGIPIPASKKKEDNAEITVELVESEEEGKMLIQFENKQ